MDTKDVNERKKGDSSGGFLLIKKLSKAGGNFCVK
jgi:hypothetical protein